MLHNLKLLRHEHGISQQRLADAIHVSQPSINKYENHNIEPDIGTLIRIAEYFDTSVDYLIGNTAVRRKIENVTPYELSEEESCLVDDFRKLSKQQKRCIRTIIDSYSE